MSLGKLQSPSVRVRRALVVAFVSLGIVGPMSPTAFAIDANGNALTGGLSFTPAFSEAEVGDRVAWRNTDPLAPHTATERHDLWSLDGDFGPPLTAGGFPPGATVSRTFEAGTHDYLCVIHGPVMSGRVSVPVTLERNRRGVRGIWAASPPASGLVFDVEVRSGGGWRPLLEGTRKTRALLSRRGRNDSADAIEVRARLRSAAEPARRTGWSPVARSRS